jgi:hypothetical protein
VSRRRLFGLMGGAAAAGTGLAVAGSVLGASSADATSGNMQFGASNDAGSAATVLTSTGVPTLQVNSTGGNTPLLAYAVPGTATEAADFWGASGSAVIRLQPDGGASSPPSSGLAGHVWVNGSSSVTELWYCVASATGSPHPAPAVWVKVSSPLVPITPARVYDSRPSQSPPTFPKVPISNGGTVMVDVTGTQATPPGGPSGVPTTGASAVLGNITVVNPAAQVFLTVYAAGTTPPATSNINALAGGVVANNFTAKVGTGGSANKIAITCGGGPTDFIIDIFGYYR